MLGLGIGLGMALPLASGRFSNEYSLAFDGTNDSVDLRGDDSFGEALAGYTFKNSGSVSCWMKIATSSTNGTLWDFTVDSNNRVFLQYKHSTDTLVLNRKSSGTSKLVTFNPDPATLEGDDTWHHIACTWDSSGDMKIYVDGTLADTRDISTTTFAGDYDDVGVSLTLGESFSGGADLWGGLDELVVYKSVINQTVVDDLYNGGKPKQLILGEVIAHWRFEEGEGTTVVDSIVGYTGSIAGAVYATDVA
jgi:hypothetical protein